MNNTRIALIGNPNSGKTSIFNQLTGMRQRTGNFPGITVDKKTGKLIDNEAVEVVDLPGLYDLYPDSTDEAVVLRELVSPDKDYDGVVYVADASHLDRSLLLYSQLADLGIPMIFVVNMMDEAEKSGYRFNTNRLKNRLGVPIIYTDARSGEGVDRLLSKIEGEEFDMPNAFFRSRYTQTDDVFRNGYRDWISTCFDRYLKDNTAFSEHSNFTQNIDNQLETSILEVSQNEETDEGIVLEDIENRKRLINIIAGEVVQSPKETRQNRITEQLDRWLTHPIFGYLIFGGILFLIFQAIFSWAALPMDLMDWSFSHLSGWVQSTFGDSLFGRLLAEGIIPGISGVLIFIPQIALLFLFIGLLEASGYMSRVVFLMDKLMQRFGLNGKSVVPLMSGMACAIPAVMACRTIENPKERLITILVTPFMTCSARLPVYAILIAVTIPATKVMGMNLQGLVLLALYLLGIFAALFGAAILNNILKNKEKSYLIQEMPVYRIPKAKDILLNIWSKVKTFVWEAGRIIFVLALLLWVLASYGPNLQQKTEDYRITLTESGIADAESIDDQVNAYKLEHSYIGIVGKTVEPVFRPLGYDWKISIALLTSFAAREVFVGTLATIYSIGEDFSEETITQKLESEVDAVTGRKRFNLATSLSLLFFYALAMQCISTLAIVRRETKSWMYPILQLVIMTVLAYLGALAIYQILG